MSWSVVVLGSLAVLVALSLALPTWRRVWAFNLRVLKYLALWLLDVCRVRLLWMKLTGRPYVRLTRPVMARSFCEDMGPTFIKFGQIVASSAGFFPDRYVVEFHKCLDRVRPFPFADVRAIIESDLGAERAAQLTDIDPEPLASASIAQVHTALLRTDLDESPNESADEPAHGPVQVVIKVQRPGIERLVEVDMRIMRVMARIAARVVPDAELSNPVGIVDDFAATLREELDFCLEADNQERFNGIMADLGHDNIRAPVPYRQFTSRRVLVMERFFGLRVDQVEEIRARDVDAEAQLVAGLRAWFQCVVFHGFFHGDVHAGNLMLLDGDDIGFLDFGIVGRFTDHERWLVTDYILAFSMGDFGKLAQVIADMDSVPADLDVDAFIADLTEAYAPMRELSFGELNFADFMPKIQRVASRHRMRLPNEFVLITKQMLYFDRYAKLLAPELNIFTDPRLLMSMMMDITKARADFHQKQAV